MLLGSVGHLTFAPAIRKDLGYDPRKDLTRSRSRRTSLSSSRPRNTLPANSIQELIALAKSKPAASATAPAAAARRRISASSC